ncbi:MAG: SGNH/GDSL hydrolase family protein [Myxococcota bacterium]
MPEPPAHTRLSVKLLAIVLPVVLLLGFAELAQRASDWRKNAKRADRSDPYSIRAVTRTGHPIGARAIGGDVRGRLALELRPHLIFANRADQHLDGVTINAQGFRGGDWELERKPGTRRVIVLGGSTAFGKAASSDSRTFAARLEYRLQRRRATEVWSAGVIGYDSNQEAILLRSRLLDYRPDLLIFFDGWNDFYNSGRTPDGRQLEHPHFLEVEEALVEAERPWRNLLWQSAFVRGLERKWPAWRRSLGWDEPEEREFGIYRHSPEAVARYAKNLERMIRLARAYGVDSLVAPQPEIFDRAEPSEFEQYKRDQLEADGYAAYAQAHWLDYVGAARRVAEAEGVPFVEVQDLFDEAEGDVFTDLVHLTDLGQEIVAEALHEPVARVLDARSR